MEVGVEMSADMEVEAEVAMEMFADMEVEVEVAMEMFAYLPMPQEDKKRFKEYPSQRGYWERHLDYTSLCGDGQ